MALTIEIHPSAGETKITKITIAGVVDEDTEFGELEQQTGRLEINLKGVRRINSYGARLWMEMVRTLGQKAAMTFVECSPPVIDQLNMIQGFLGRGNVKSFYGTMLCERCDGEKLHLFDVSDIRNNDGHLPRVDCDQCRVQMEFDDLEDQYTLFLREPTRVG